MVFKNLAPLLAKDGVIFGSTILGTSVPQNRLAKKLMAIYNKKGIFHNTHDDEQTLRTMLETYFSQVEITIEGCVALFKATA